MYRYLPVYGIKSCATAEGVRAGAAGRQYHYCCRRYQIRLNVEVQRATMPAPDRSLARQ
jgi:hypothetical protein